MLGGSTRISGIGPVIHTIFEKVVTFCYIIVTVFSQGYSVTEFG